MHACMHGGVDAAGCASAFSCVYDFTIVCGQKDVLHGRQSQQMVVHYVRMLELLAVDAASLVPAQEI